MLLLSLIISKKNAYLVLTDVFLVLLATLAPNVGLNTIIILEIVCVTKFVVTENVFPWLVTMVITRMVTDALKIAAFNQDIVVLEDHQIHQTFALLIALHRLFILYQGKVI